MLFTSFHSLPIPWLVPPSPQMLKIRPFHQPPLRLLWTKVRQTKGTTILHSRVNLLILITLRKISDPVFIYGVEGQGIYLQIGGKEAIQIVRNVSSAPYIAVNEFKQTVYWAGSVVNQEGDAQLKIFELSFESWKNAKTEASTFTIPFSKKVQKDTLAENGTLLPVNLTWLEYDWVGDNVYFVDVNRGICLCNRHSDCTIVVDKGCINGELSQTKIALDSQRG